MKSPSLETLHLPAADGKHDDEPKDHPYDDSVHPVWLIANKIAIFFLAASAVAFLALMTDAILTRT
jgi:hypothetical protein